MDSEEFSQRYAALKDRLFNFLLRLSGDRAEAEEAFSEAVTRAWKMRHQFRGESCFSTWITAIALNAWRSRRRSEGRMVRMDEHTESLLADRRPDPEQTAGGKEQGARLELAVRSLSEPYRLPLLLRYSNDLSFREIAEVLGISEELARVRTHRARHILATMLGEEQ